MKELKHLEDELKALRPARVTDSKRIELLGEGGEQVASDRFWFSAVAALLVLTALLAGLAVYAMGENDKEENLVEEDQKIEKPEIAPKPKEMIAKQEVPQRVYYYLGQPRGKDIFYIEDQPFRKVRYLVMDRENREVDGNTVELLQPRQEEYFVPITNY